MVTEKAFMSLNDGSLMYSFCVPPVEAAVAPPPSPALAADVCDGPLQPTKVSAIRIVASLPLVLIVDNLCISLTVIACSWQFAL
jgi:hypothetical protein